MKRAAFPTGTVSASIRLRAQRGESAMTPSRRDIAKHAGKPAAAVPPLPSPAEFSGAGTRVWALRNSRLELVAEQALDHGAWRPADLIVIAIGGPEALPVEQIGQIAEDQTAPPVVVYGPYPAAAWREKALNAGAFLCFSSKTPIEDQHTLLAAAICYGAVLSENYLLRAESENVSQGLLRAYGDAMERVRHASDEAWGIQSTLENVQQRILKVLS
jgi:DNA-binding NarL/FixJ family response regulator